MDAMCRHQRRDVAKRCLQRAADVAPMHRLFDQHVIE
jgi:hypothetical protein